MFFHVAICYFRPKRPTFTRVRLAPDLVWNHRHVLPVKKPCGAVDALIDVALLEELTLTQPLTMQLHKLIVFDRYNYKPYEPSARLTIDDLHKHLDCIPESIQWWPGSDEALAIFHKESDKKRAVEERRKAREHAGEKQDHKQKRAAPQSKQKRDVQKRRDKSSRTKPQLALLPPEKGDVDADDSDKDFWSFLDEDDHQDAVVEEKRKLRLMRSECVSIKTSVMH